MRDEDERFVRRENVKHYRDLLERSADEKHRSRIKKLLAEEEQKQIDAGDFFSGSDKIS
jgi:hypothetical protein